MTNDSMSAGLEIGADEALDTPLQAGTGSVMPTVVCRLDLDDEALDRPLMVGPCCPPGATRVN